MPRMYAYANAVPWVGFDPRLALASFYEDAALSYWSSVNGRLGVMAKAVIDLNDQATAETNRRFDRMETLFAEVRADLGGVKAQLGEVRADLGEVKADLGGVKVGLAELTLTVNRIDARVEQQAAWIAGDEAKGRRKRS